MDAKERNALLWDKGQAEMIIRQLENRGELQIYACDCTGVRCVGPLLSDEQKAELQEYVIRYMEDLVLDIETELAET